MSVLTGCRRINRVEFKENERVFFPQGENKLAVSNNDVSVLSGCS